MSSMIRKQVYIAPAQEKLLKERSARLGVTESELIRQGIELTGRTPNRGTRDEKAWREELAFLKRRARKSRRTAVHGRGWTRDKLYEL